MNVINMMIENKRVLKQKQSIKGLLKYNRSGNTQ